MEAVHVTTAHHRVPDAPSSSGVTNAGAAVDYLERPLPIATAVRWIPAGQSSAVDPVHPVFIAQGALAAVQGQAQAPPDVAASFGFLLGDVYIAPETHTQYVVVDLVVPTGWWTAGDDLKAALLEARAIAEEDARRNDRRIVGWYQTHAAADPRPSAAEAEAHLACFSEPWHVALMIAGPGGLGGGVFQIASRTARSDQYLPFYELVEGDATALPWENYRAPGLVFPAIDAVRSSSPHRSPRVLLDDMLDEEALNLEALRPPRRRLSFPGLRAVTVGGVGLATLGVLFGIVRRGAVALPVAPPPPSSAVTADAVGRLRDTVAYAVAAFDLRAGLFAGHKMGCADLARGLVHLEDRWTAYNTALASTPPHTDPAKIESERRLNQEVAAVERRYTRTGCPRP